MIRISILTLLFLLIGCANQPAKNKDRINQRILLGDYEIHIPSRFVQDLRGFQNTGVINFDEYVDGEMTGAVVGISLEGFDDEAAAAFTRLGFRNESQCTTLIFSKEIDELGSNSTIVAIPPAYIVLSRLAQRDQEVILNSLCSRTEVTESGWGYRKVER